MTSTSVSAESSTTDLPPVGTLVHDGRSGRTGVLMYAGDWQDPYTLRTHREVAFLRQARGGTEWMTSLRALTPAPLDSQHPACGAFYQQRGQKKGQGS
ncbi:hypothetical protein [Streptomyces sp. NPDC037389]|uniref:hypothetical protein n=1 Tax=Streptomyces sp. NPDC037389 TaxID=3155369 RepID=UPI003406D7B4